MPRLCIGLIASWFWTPEWQAGEREVEEDLRAGRTTGPFKTVEEMKKHLGDA